VNSRVLLLLLLFTDTAPLSIFKLEMGLECHDIWILP
jgi:hypothetical protein